MDAPVIRNTVESRVERSDGRRKNMTPCFEDLRKTLLGEYVGRVPIAEIDVAETLKEQVLGRPVSSADDEVEFWRQAGYDYVLFTIEQDFCRGTFPRYREALPPPVLAKNLEDARTLKWPNPEKFNIVELDTIARHLPSTMKIIPRLGGLLYFPSVILGFENLCLALYQDQELAKYVFNRVGKIVLDLVHRLLGHPAVGAIWLSCDMAYGTGLLISADHLRQYVFPWIQRIASAVRRAGCPLLLHSDGNLEEILDDLVALGIDALHPVEPAAMDIRKLHRRYGNSLCLIGNVDVDLLISGSPEEIAREAESLLVQFEGKGGYVLGSGNSIPSAVPLNNYRSLIQCGKPKVYANNFA